MIFLRRTAHVASIVVPLLWVATCSLASQSRPQNQNQTNSRQQETDIPQHGTEAAPIFVQPLPVVPTKKQTEQETADREAKYEADKWTFRLTLATVLVGLLQAFIYWKQARSLRDTIAKMDEIAKSQTHDMLKSIAESVRSADAMERVAKTLTENTDGLKTSIGISREIADRQKLITELQSRAYLAVGLGEVIEQNNDIGLRFQPQITVTNKGNTPAYRVRLIVKADTFLYSRVPDAFTFPVIEVPDVPGNEIGPGLMKTSDVIAERLYAAEELNNIVLGVGPALYIWGIVLYDDVFRERQRFAKFAFKLLKKSGQRWVTLEAFQHNESN